MGTFVLGLSWTVIVLALLLLVRNHLVYRFRMRCIDFVYDDKDWIALSRVYESVSYDRMVAQFWKPLRSFYEGTALEVVK